MADEHDKPLVHRKRSAYRRLSVGITLGDQMCAAGDLEVVQLGPRAVGITAESVERVAREGAVKLAALKAHRKAARAAPSSAA